MSRDELGAFIADKLGHKPEDLALFERALTHSSATRDSYERLEFLGDRVLGLIVARWLYERFEPSPRANCRTATMCSSPARAAPRSAASSAFRR